MNLNLMRIEDKTRDEKAMEKKNNVEEICASSLDCMLIKRDNAVREKPAKVKIILSLWRWYSFPVSSFGIVLRYFHPLIKPTTIAKTI